MQHDGQMDRLMGRQGKPQQPVERVEDPHLAVGQERCAHKEIRIPERQPPGPHHPRRLRPVGVKVGEDVAASQHPPRQRDLPVEGADEAAKGQDGKEVAEEDRWLVGWLAGWMGHWFDSDWT